MQATRIDRKQIGRDGIGVGSAGREVLQLDRKKLLGVKDTVTISTVEMPPCLHTYIVYLNIHHTSYITYLNCGVCIHPSELFKCVQVVSMSVIPQ